MIIEFYRTNKYGATLFYVKDERRARQLTSITGRKTISLADIVTLTDLGLKFKEVLPVR